MTTLSVDVVNEICHQYAQEGLVIAPVRVDDADGRVEVELTVIDPGMMDNPPPGAYLEYQLTTGLRARTRRDFVVVVHDARRSTMARDEATVAILDPRVRPVAAQPDSGPDAGPLRGKTVLIRLDVLWRSWDWVADVWAAALTDAGAHVVTWRRSQGTTAQAGADLQKEYEDLVSSSDILISGLGNCGSCTAWTIRDALEGLSQRRSTLAVVTSQFAAIARAIATGGHYPDLRIYQLPYPLNDLPEENVREIARQAVNEALAQLGAER